MRRIGERAVVLGASIGGLVAARVLTEAFPQVTLVDRDDLLEGAVPRRGVPQGPHTHALLARGREVLEELFPGLTDELLAYGAQGADLQQDVRFYNDGHLLFRRPSGMRGVGLTRPLLEDRLRTRVRGLPGVELLTPADGEPVMTGGRVTGVRIHPGPNGSPPAVLDADLVVDATGRGSHIPAWLESAGFPRPAETTIELGVGYSTWIFPRRPDDLAGDSGVLIGATVRAPRFGAAVLVECDRWMITAGGYQGDRPPTDLDSFREYLTGLPVPDLAELVAELEPVEAPRAYRFQSSTRRHYERLTRFPDGLLVIGDALSSFNPIYGQGMTVVALEARALRDLLAEGGTDLPRRFFREAARLIDIPWDIAAGGDLRIPVVPGPRPLRTRLVNRYVGRVQAVAAVDPEVGLAFLRVANLVESPEALLRPRVALRLAAASLRAPSRPKRAAGRRPGIPSSFLHTWLTGRPSTSQSAGQGDRAGKRHDAEHGGVVQRTQHAGQGQPRRVE